MTTWTSFSECLLIQSQIDHSTAQLLALLLELLQLLRLISSHAAVLLAPTVVSLLCDTHPPDRVNTGKSLSGQHINLAQLRDSLFGAVTLRSDLQPSFHSLLGWINSMGEDQNDTPNWFAPYVFRELTSCKTGGDLFHVDDVTRQWHTSSSPVLT